MACYIAMGGGGGGGSSCAQGWFSNFDFRFSFFVFRALAHCLIYAAVLGLWHMHMQLALLNAAVPATSCAHHIRGIQERSELIQRRVWMVHECNLPYRQHLIGYVMTCEPVADDQWRSSQAKEGEQGRC